MKKCGYCGAEYPDASTRCHIDGELLGAKDLPAEPADPISSPALIDLGMIEGAFVLREGYSRPDWKRIAAAIERGVEAGNRKRAWAEAALQWVRQLQSDLGSAYQASESEQFILLSALAKAEVNQLLVFAEGVLERIQQSLRDAASRSISRKQVILLFAEEDDYYQYVSDFYGEGVHPASGGCLLHRDYVHIAIPYLAGKHIRQVLVHELLHACVVHLTIPLWLNEGLAVSFDRTVTDWRRPILDHDLRDRHLAFWNPQNIQKFWSGVSFREPGDSTELSYGLAEIIVQLLLPKVSDFGTFLKQARSDDAGQTAAMDCLGVDLGTAVATFLGEGNWRPNRKAMVECWNAARKIE